MLTSQNTRTVSLRRAWFSLAGALLILVICAACLVFFLALAAFFSASPALLIAPLLGTVLSAIRARRWSRAIRRATSQSPDEMRWRP